MHSLNHYDLAHALAADRVGSVSRGVARPRRHRPPPIRRRVAYAVARVADWLDSESARKAVA
jgi:hypothetical protein